MRRYISRKLGGSIFSKVASIAAKLFRVAYLYNETMPPEKTDLHLSGTTGTFYARNWIVRKNTSLSEKVSFDRKKKPKI